MNMSNYLDVQDVLVPLDAPTSFTDPPGDGVRIDKAGIGGERRSPVAAAAEWCRRFSMMVTLPEGESEGDESLADPDEPPR